MRARTEMTSATGEFAQTLYDLAGSDLGEPLSHSISGLAGVESKAHEFMRIQTEQDMVTLMSTGERCIRTLTILKVLISITLPYFQPMSTQDW